MGLQTLTSLFKKASIRKQGSDVVDRDRCMKGTWCLHVLLLGPNVSVIQRKSDKVLFWSNKDNTGLEFVPKQFLPEGHAK